MNRKFNVQKLEKLNDPARLKIIPPEYIWNNLNLHGCRTIVDIGAGTGLFSRAFLNLTKGGTVFAADISEVMVSWMKNNICDDNPEIVPLLMDETSVPLEDGLADLVLMINLHHELDNPGAMLAESFRLLNSRGKICIVDWKKEKMPVGPPYEIRVSEGEIQNQLQKAGFMDIRSDNILSMNSLVHAVKNGE